MSYKKAQELYEEFYQFKARSARQVDLKLPTSVTLEGHMRATMYASDKWERKTNGYRHEHEAGVRIYVPGGRTRVPAHIVRCEAFVRLGDCLGVEYIDTEGNEVLVSDKGCDLYASANAKALLIVRRKPLIVEALIWGGKLDIDGRGILH